jgi:rhodanese-related sulfurtransferase
MRTALATIATTDLLSRAALNSTGELGMAEPLEISCADVKGRLDRRAKFLLLDCREPDEHATASIAGATLIPMSELQQRVSELGTDKGLDIVVHCHHGGRSLRVAHWLRAQGFAKAASMAGGIDEWSQTIDVKVPRY